MDGPEFEISHVKIIRNLQSLITNCCIFHFQVRQIKVIISAFSSVSSQLKSGGRNKKQNLTEFKSFDE